MNDIGVFAEHLGDDAENPAVAGLKELAISSAGSKAGHAETAISWINKTRGKKPSWFEPFDR